jgi:hypothetical protein
MMCFYPFIGWVDYKSTGSTYTVLVDWTVVLQYQVDVVDDVKCNGLITTSNMLAVVLLNEDSGSAVR